jgi:hypothetical protein
MRVGNCKGEIILVVNTAGSGDFAFNFDLARPGMKRGPYWKRL